MKSILLSLSMICFFASCQYKTGSGNIVTQNRNMGSFTGVEAGGGVDVEIKIGSTTKVMVEADDNIIDDIETSIENNKLKISIKDGVSFNNARMKIFIMAPAITSISSSAAADIEAKDVLTSDSKITIRASSGSSIKAPLNAPITEADASSGSDIELSGRTKNLEVQASSGASIDAYELLSENTIAETSSGASVEVHASVQLNAKASSGGIVSYKGEASTVKKENSGGSVNKKD